MNHSILLFEDKLGISEGYRPIWEGILMRAGLNSYGVFRRSAYKEFGDRVPLLIQRGNRKAPGFNADNPAVLKVLSDWTQYHVQTLKPTMCICMDPALLHLFNPDWDQATLDNLRGGHYYLHGVHTVIMFGISAWYSKKREKDIAKMNDGFVDKDEWAEEHGGDETDDANVEIWIEPVSVPYGRFTLQADVNKVGRIMRELTQQEHSDERISSFVPRISGR